jgi:hypothetical protein
MIFGHIGVYWVQGKKSLRDSHGELLSINADIGIYWHTCARCFSPEWKSSKTTKTWFLDIFECFGCIRGKKLLRDSRDEHGCNVLDREENCQKEAKHEFLKDRTHFDVLMAKTRFMIRSANLCQLVPILAYFGRHGWDVFDRNEKVQKAPKHDFWIYWSVMGVFVAKTYFVIRTMNFCQLMPILANFGPHGCDVFDRNEKVQKAPKHDFWTYLTLLGAFVTKTHFLIRAANFCQLMPKLAGMGPMFLTGNKQITKHHNMIFGDIWL